MPEERMIRINYPDKTLDNDVDIRVHLYYYDPNGQLQTPIFGINKEYVEPAPPKDWRPYCFSDYNLDGKCDCEEYYMMASCDKCPYHDVAEHQQKGKEE